jgi:hypothetical protein
VDRDVRNFLLDVDVYSGDVWTLAEALLDALDARLAGQRSGLDSQRG